MFSYRAYLVLLFLVYSFYGNAQITLEGYVKDSTTKKPIPFVKLKFENEGTYARTDTAGYFKISSTELTDTLVLSFIGYNEKTIAYSQGMDLNLTIYLVESNTNLNTVVIDAGENPAFEILRKIKENKKFNNPEKLEAYQCEVYNKMQFDINNMSEKFEDRGVFKKFDFMMDYMDTVNGERYLPVLLSESISDYYFKKAPQQKKEVIRATRITELIIYSLDNLPVTCIKMSIFIMIMLNCLTKSF